MIEFYRLQLGLAAALEASGAGSTVEHVVLALPSHSMPERLITHHAALLPALEERALLESLRLARSPHARVVVVLAEAPAPEVLAYYARLAPPDSPSRAERRISVTVVDDDTPRGVAAKLVERPDLLALLRDKVGGAPAVVEPWNVTAVEAAVAVALGAPVNGSPPTLWPLGFKSASRRLFRRAGVPVPAGVEDVHDGAEVAAAVRDLRCVRPELNAVVVKLDNSGAGEGNWVMSTRADDGRRLTVGELDVRFRSGAPAWFVSDLERGGVVEELVTGHRMSSPSAQAEIAPHGEVTVLATHEQVMGGADGQVFLGSTFPADDAYAARLGHHVAAVAHVLADLGATGWLAVDFVATFRDGTWDLVAVDLNLRKGGTTHPYTALQHLVPGRYDVVRHRWLADADDRPRHYRSSDAVRSSRWTGMAPMRAIHALGRAGLDVDHATGTGVVLHSFTALGRDGTIGVTAIGRSAAEAEDLFDAVPSALDAELAQDAPGVAAGGRGRTPTSAVPGGSDPRDLHPEALEDDPETATRPSRRG